MYVCRTVSVSRCICIGIVATVMALALHPARADETPRPVECNAAPRTLNDIVDLAAQPAPAASPPARSGEPAAPEAIEAATATLRASIACVNANRPLAAFAYFTDGYLSRAFGGANTDALGHLRVALTRTPAPAEPGDQLSLRSISDVTIPAAGELLMTAVTVNADGVYTDRLLLREVDGRWLIDQVISLDPPPPSLIGATPTP